jgi:biopolymer transport protein ExbB
MAPSATYSRPRWAAFGAAGLLAAFLAVFLAPAPPAARAQDNPPAAGEAAPAPGPAPPAAPERTGLFWHIVRSAGLVFGPLLLLVSIGLVTLIVLLAMDLRMGSAVPPGFVEDFTDTVNRRKFKEAYEMAKEDDSYLGRVLATGMARLQYGLEDAREATYATVESIKAGKEQLITYLATIGTLGPMLGLVGTVWGMIGAFKKLGETTAPKPSELAENIAHALVVTLLGVALSVPAIFFHAFFRNRLVRLSMDTANIADDLLTQMYHNSKKPAPPPGAAPAPAASATTADANAVPMPAGTIKK